MTDVIFIRTDYSHGIILPIELLRFVQDIQVVKTEYYSQVDSIEIDPEFQKTFSIISSHKIGEAAKKAERIKEAQADLEANQKYLDSLTEEKK